MLAFGIRVMATLGVIPTLDALLVHDRLLPMQRNARALGTELLRVLQWINAFVSL